MLRRSEFGEKGKVKLRIVEFELEGNDATLQESLRSISATINRGTAGGFPSSVKSMNALTSVLKTPPKNGGEPVATASIDDADGPEQHDVDPVEEAGNESPAQRRRPVKYPEPKTLPNINFNDGEVPLKKFMDDKKPKGHNQKFLVTAAWFKLYGHVEETTTDHVYTAYQAMEWKSRKNMAQPFYFLKGRGWITQSGGGWKLTHIGLDKARELPAAE